MRQPLPKHVYNIKPILSRDKRTHQLLSLDEATVKLVEGARVVEIPVPRVSRRAASIDPVRPPPPNADGEDAGLEMEAFRGRDGDGKD